MGVEVEGLTVGERVGDLVGVLVVGALVVGEVVGDWVGGVVGFEVDGEMLGADVIGDAVGLQVNPQHVCLQIFLKNRLFVSSS